MSAVINSSLDGQRELPWFHLIVLNCFFLTIAAGDVLIFGYQLSGMGWLIPLAAGVLTIGARAGSSAFPLSIWIPWILVLLIYAVVSPTENSWHRTLILLTPLVVGMAAGVYRLNDWQMHALFRLIAMAAVVGVVAIGIKAAGELLKAERETYAFPAESMSAVLILSLLAAQVPQRPWLLPYTFLAAAIPLVSVNRTAIVAALFVLTFGFLPIRLVYRIAIAVMGTVAALLIFQLESVQSKMFFSGSGTILDLYASNPDLRTSGRQVIWGYLYDRAWDSPWFGHGANASEREVFDLTEGIAHPHNDWLRFFYDYGIVGTAAFAGGYVGLLYLTLRAMRLEKRSFDKYLFGALATAWIAFGIFMITDNIVLYAGYFTAPFFLLLGTALVLVAPPVPDFLG